MICEGRRSGFGFDVRIAMGCALTLLAVALDCRGLGAEVNLLSHPSFEAGTRGWVAQDGKMTLISDPRQAHTGKNALRVVAAPAGKQWVGRMFCSSRVDVVPGARYRLSAWVKGQGQATVGMYEYSVQNRVPKFQQRVSMPAAQGLDAEWRQISLVYKPTDERVTSGSFYAQVTGESSQMLVDDVEVRACPEPDLELSLGRLPAMVPAGRPLPVALDLRGKLPSPQVELVLRNAEGVVLARHTARPAGGASESLSLSLPAGTDGCVLLTAVEQTSGAVAIGNVDVCPDEAYRECAAAAADVRLPGSCHLVFVGDSLTAFFRGHNYVDKVRWWLQGRFGAAVEVTNAGVGGDTILRVKDRLEKDILGLKPRPTHVFIFLGHNDSKLKSTTAYREPVVLPVEFERSYRDVVRTVQTTLGARVVVISATSSVYEITQATAAESARRGKTHNLFGKPEALEQFNAIARKVANELGAGYLDVYEPFRTCPGKASLFTPDGVHINERGNRLMTLEILKYLSR